MSAPAMKLSGFPRAARRRDRRVALERGRAPPTNSVLHRARERVDRLARQVEGDDGDAVAIAYVEGRCDSVREGGQRVEDSSGALDDHGVPHPAGRAHGQQAELSAAAAQLVAERREDARAGRAERDGRWRSSRPSR